MINFFLKLILLSAAVIITSFLLPGVDVDGFVTAFLVAIVLSLLNVFVKPILVFITLPLTLFTLGLFILIINTGIILMADYVVPGFEVQGFWWAFLFSLILSLLYSVLEGISRKESKNQQY